VPRKNVTLDDLERAIRGVPKRHPVPLSVTTQLRLDKAYHLAVAQAWKTAFEFVLANSADEREPEGTDELITGLTMIELSMNWDASGFKS
jgi:hypothetical protein